MLSQTDASNKELSRCMDQLERNGSMSSTPLSSPTLNHRSSPAAVLQSVLPPPLSQDAVAGMKTVGQGDPSPSSAAMQPPAHNTINRDAVVSGVDVLRSIPSISSTVTQLLASYDQQAVQDALPGKGNIDRRKSRRYNTTDTTLVGPQLRWPNEDLISGLHGESPPMMNLTYQNVRQGSCLMPC